MSGISLTSAVRALVAPVGTNPADPDGGWQDLGLLDADGLAFTPHAPSQPATAKPGMSPATIAFTIGLRMLRCSWWAHQFMYGRPHPGQRRAKTLYRRRARRRTRRRR